jgi:hypothetical protein
MSTQMFVLALLLASADARDDVLKLLEQQPERTDLVILIDTSGSMHKHFAATQEFARQLAALKHEGDTVTLLSMAERTGVLSATAKLAPPKGRFTDLGEALSMVSETLLRPSYAPISMVFLVTDFCAEPPPGSKYLGEVEGSGPCRSVVIDEHLSKRSKQLTALGDQEIRVIALAIEPTSEAGIQAAREVLGPVDRVDVSGDTLKTTLDNLRARIAYDRAALQVEKMLKTPPLSIVQERLALPLQGAVPFKLELKSSSALPIETTVENIRAADGSIVFENETASYVVKTPWSPKDPPREVELQTTVRFRIGPSAGVEKLLGRAPEGRAVLRKKVLVELSPNEPPHLVLQVEKRQQLEPGASKKLVLLVESTVSWAELEASCAINGAPPVPIRFAPLGRAELVTDLSNRSTLSRFKLPEIHEELVEHQVDCVVTAVTKDGTRLGRGTQSMNAVAVMTWKDGTSPWTVAVLFGAALFLVLVYLRELKPRMAPASLFGRLVVYDGPGDFRKVTVPLKGRVCLAFEGVSAAAESGARVDGDRVVLPGMVSSAELYAEKSGKRSVMRLRKISGDAIKVGESDLGAQPVVMKRGRARFSIGEYFCRIE